VNVDRALETLIGKEGGYSNHPSDTGGETMWGITIAVARANGYQGPMRDMPRETAKAIYRNKYFVLPGFAAVALHSEAIAEELFDTGVNMGPSVASTFLQRLLTALNRGGKDYPDLKPDGDIGPKTLSALKAYLAKRPLDGQKVMLRGLNALQGARYIALAEGRQANEDFLHGWLANRVVI
jgi:lysozyme family protein